MGELPLQDMELQIEENEKYTEADYKEPTDKIPINFRLTVIQMIGQSKTFYRQRIREPSCAWKEIVERDILLTTTNGDKKKFTTNQNKWTSHENKGVGFNQFRLTFTKVMDLHWPQ